MPTSSRASARRARWSGSRSTGARGTQNPALRALYAELVRAHRAPSCRRRALGPRVELGSGPGFAREFIPDLELTDLVRAPWHDREVSAEALPFADGSVGALVLFDVLHHLPSPRRFFDGGGARAARRAGRIVMCEPYISPLSYPVYKFLHEEPLDLSVDPLALDRGRRRRRAIRSTPTRRSRRCCSARQRQAFAEAFPGAVRRARLSTCRASAVRPRAGSRTAVPALRAVVAAAPDRRRAAVGVDALDWRFACSS